MAGRFVEQTLHTGRVAYVHAPGLTDLDFPVLVRPLDERYDYVIARVPTEDQSGLFYRVWEPTRSMQLLATDLFRDWYRGQPQPIQDERYIWEAVWRIHRLASIAPSDAQRRAHKSMNRIAAALSERSGEYVPPVSLAPVAEAYQWLGGLVFPNYVTASFASATLLLMLGVPRERVAVFGMYYQDPTIYYRPDSDWQAGFLSGTPYYTVLGIFLLGRWIPIDLTLVGNRPYEQMPAQPAPHLRPAQAGYHPTTGAPLVIDYAHPYTMVFAPPRPGMDYSSPLLGRIPLLQV